MKGLYCVGVEGSHSDSVFPPQCGKWVVSNPSGNLLQFRRCPRGSGPAAEPVSMSRPPNAARPPVLILSPPPHICPSRAALLQLPWLLCPDLALLSLAHLAGPSRWPPRPPYHHLRSRVPTKPAPPRLSLLAMSTGFSHILPMPHPRLQDMTFQTAKPFHSASLHTVHHAASFTLKCHSTSVLAG